MLWFLWYAWVLLFYLIKKSPHGVGSVQQIKRKEAVGPCRDQKTFVHVYIIPDGDSCNQHLAFLDNDIHIITLTSIYKRKSSAIQEERQSRPVNDVLKSKAFILIWNLDLVRHHWQKLVCGNTPKKDRTLKSKECVSSTSTCWGEKDPRAKGQIVWWLFRLILEN